MICINPSTLRSLIDNRNPFITGILWESKAYLFGKEFELIPLSGHAVVGYGYDLKRNHILFLDPLPGTRKGFSIESNVAGYKLKTEFGEKDKWGYYASTSYLNY